jgi:hypothetical protein
MIAFYYIFRFLAKLFLPLKKVVEKRKYAKQQQQAQDASWKKTQTRMRCFIIRLMPKNPHETKKWVIMLITKK